MSQETASHRYVVVVAGGSGTRLWPLSRQRLPKQMQALMSDKSLISETVDRLTGVLPPERILISTTENYCGQMREMLPAIPPANFIVEPVARGTSAAFALFTHQLALRDPEAVVFSLASDHAITEVEKFQQTVQESFAFVEAHPRQIAIVGIRPTSASTGLGYIKVRKAIQKDPLVFDAEKFVEKPTHEVAVRYLESGEYFWNSAYYCFRAATLLEAYDDADPRLVAAARAYTDSGDPADYLLAPEKVHEIEIIDTKTYPMAVVAADFNWSDIGNWLALYQVLSELVGEETVAFDASRHVDVKSTRLLVNNPDGRLVATAGLEDIVIVSTDDAVLVLDMAKLEAMPELMQELLRKLPKGDGYL